METRLSNILKTTNATKFIKTILERTNKVVLGTYNFAFPIRPRLFVRGRWVLCNFWHLDCYNFCYILEKLRSYAFWKPHIGVGKHAKNHIHRATHYGETVLWKLKILSFLVPFISKIKTVDIFNFLSVKQFSKGLLFLKIWHIRVSYCWNYGPWNLLFCFFCCRLGYLNSKPTKSAETWTIHFFES